MSNNQHECIPAELLISWVEAARIHTSEELEDKIEDYHAELALATTTDRRANILRTLIKIAEDRLAD